MNSLHHPTLPVKRNPPLPVQPRSLAGRRLAERHHVPNCLADLIAHLAGFREAL
jgi:hypothetical protein